MSLTEYDGKWSDWYLIIDSSSSVICKCKQRFTRNSPVAKLEFVITAISDGENSTSDNHWHFEMLIGPDEGETEWRVLSVNRGNVSETMVDDIKGAIEEMSFGKISL